MTKSTIIFGLIGFSAGALLGFITGYYASKKKDEEDIEYWRSKSIEKDETKKEVKEESSEESKKQQEDKDFAEKASHIISPGPAKIAMPGEPGVNYTAYAKKVEELKYKAESESPKDSDEDEEEQEDEEVNEEDFPQTYDERIKEDTVELTHEFEVYKQKHKKDFYILSKGYDDEWPDIHFDEKQLFYMTVDDLLVDEDGRYVDEKATIGNDLRKFGWFINRNMVTTTVRNMKDEVDYKISKQFTDYEDFFGHNAPDPEDEEIE